MSAIKSLTPQSNIDDFTKRILADIKKVLINQLIYVGEQCIKHARLYGNYQDQTGNLRSSIGFCVLDNSEPVHTSGFEQVLKGSEGARKGELFLQQLIAEHRKGIVLIVAAGMNYAAYVEASGYDVITGSELQAEQLIPRMLKQLGFTVTR